MGTVNGTVNPGNKHFEWAMFSLSYGTITNRIVSSEGEVCVKAEQNYISFSCRLYFGTYIIKAPAKGLNVNVSILAWRMTFTTHM